MRALLLLFVFAHAVLAGATHFHRVSQPGDGGHASAREQSADDGVSSKGHLQCVLCRLQRQFVSDGRPAGPKVIVPTADAAGPETHLCAAVSDAHPLLKRGRAPPLA